MSGRWSELDAGPLSGAKGLPSQHSPEAHLLSFFSFLFRCKTFFKGFNSVKSLRVTLF